MLGFGGIYTPERGSAMNLPPQPNLRTGELSIDKATGLLNTTKGVSVFTDSSKTDAARWGVYSGLI
jgi:hypothetical protein